MNFREAFARGTMQRMDREFYLREMRPRHHRWFRTAIPAFAAVLSIVSSFAWRFEWSVAFLAVVACCLVVWAIGRTVDLGKEIEHAWNTHYDARIAGMQPTMPPLATVRFAPEYLAEVAKLTSACRLPIAIRDGMMIVQDDVVWTYFADAHEWRNVGMGTVVSGYIDECAGCRASKATDD